MASTLAMLACSSDAGGGSDCGAFGALGETLDGGLGLDKLTVPNKAAKSSCGAGAGSGVAVVTESTAEGATWLDEGFCKDPESKNLAKREARPVAGAGEAVSVGFISRLPVEAERVFDSSESSPLEEKLKPGGGPLGLDNPGGGPTDLLSPGGALGTAP